MVPRDGWILDEMERRKALYRDLFAGRSVDHVPLELRVALPSRYTVREQFRDGEKQLEAALANALATWELGPDTDAIPAMRPDVGCSCLASAFGAQYYWGESVEQTPGIREPLIKELERDLPRLPQPDPTHDGWLPEGLRRIRRFAQAGEGIVPVSLLDAAGGVNVAADLMGVSALMESFYVCPEGVHELLAKIQRLFLDTIGEGVAAAGGEANITTTDFPDLWFPEGLKGHASDDISANFGPDMYERFCAPYHAMVYERYGGGGLHNCGPNPCHRAYVAHPLSPRALDLSDTYSRGDLPALKRSLKSRAFVYLSLDRVKGPACDPGDWYREIMELMAPDVVVVPVIAAAGPEEGRAISRKLRPLCREYARRMQWGWARA